MKNIFSGKYRHYKGKKYEIIGVARHSETLEDFVVYQALYNSKKFGKNPLWVRPQKSFFEKVMKNGKKITRFKKIE